MGSEPMPAGEPARQSASQPACQYCRIPQTIVCQKHVEKCFKTHHFGHISSQSYRRVQSRWKMQTVGWKIIRGSGRCHRERENGDRSLETRPIMRTVHEKFIIRNAKESGDRSSEIHRKSASGTRKWRPFVGNATDNAYRSAENQPTGSTGTREWRPFVRNATENADRRAEKDALPPSDLAQPQTPGSLVSRL